MYSRINARFSLHRPLQTAIIRHRGSPEIFLVAGSIPMRRGPFCSRIVLEKCLDDVSCVTEELTACFDCLEGFDGDGVGGDDCDSSSGG